MKNIIHIPSLRILGATVVLSLIMAGCGDEDPENEGNHIPNVNIVQSNKTINIGTKVKLTSTAVDRDGDTLTHKWSFSSKPTGSSSTLTTDTKKSTSFVADKAGKYVIKFSSKDVVDAEGKDTVTITAKDAGAITNTCTSYTELSNSITTDTTLDGCYKVLRSISVNNAILTIKKGSTLLFSNSTGLTINSDGALKAVGTVAQPILFTGEQKTAGFWDGLRFYYSNNVKNELEYVTIEYGGGNGYGNLTLDADSGTPSRIKISNSTLQHSLHHGFWFDNGSIIDKFSNVTSTKNSKSAGLLYASAMASLDSASKFTGNTKDYITLKNSSLNTDATWQSLTVPVNVIGDIGIKKHLVIKEGYTFVFNSGTDFIIKSTGSLIAKGTKTKPILFTGEQKTAGFWDGLRFYYSNNVKNELDYVTVEYGGGNGYGNLTLDADSGTLCRIKVNSSTFSNSSKYGIWLDKGSITNSDIATSNTFTNNSSGTIRTN
jgi:hypothetical protein